MPVRSIHSFSKLLIALTVLISAQVACAADSLIDHASLELGSGPDVRIVRLAAQSDWKAHWLVGGGRAMSGYWDASIAQWRGTAYRDVAGAHQNITSIGLTPVFRYGSEGKTGWYAEAGIGAHVLSRVYNNAGRRLSTAFQFGDHVGAGYVFDNRWDLGIKLQHFSNGGIKEPNSGVNFVMVKLARPF